MAKLLGQFKIKDLGVVWEKHIMGIELSVNLTDQWKFFTRGMIANDRAGSRYSVLTEFKYSIGDVPTTHQRIRSYEYRQSTKVMYEINTIT